MKKEINRNNYEEWLVDYLDNNLTSADKVKVEHFLAIHPDISEELAELEMLPVDETIVFEDKKSLKKELDDLIPSHYSSQEEFLIAHLEGDLSSDQEKKYKLLVESNVEVKKDYDYLLLTKLKADTNIRFEDKLSLKKGVQFTLSFALNKYANVLSIAAILIVLILMINVTSIKQSIITSPGLAVFQDIQKQNPKSRSWSFNSNEKIEWPEKVLERNSHSASLAATNNAEQDVNLINKGDIVKIDNQQIQKQEGNLTVQQHVESEEKYDKKYRIEKATYTEIANAEPSTTPVSKFLAKQFRVKALNEDVSANDNRKLSGWDLADAGLRGFGKLFNKDIQLNKEYNEQGDLVALAYQSPNLGISTPLKKNRP